MGAWGTGLYSDDTTCDVRDDYVENLRHGLSGIDSSNKVLNSYGDSLENEEVACLVYFALAETAWKYGRLEDEVKLKALALLAAGADLRVWQQDAPSDVSVRRKILRNLELKLNSPQPEAKAVKFVPQKPKKIRTDAPIGSLFLLDLPSGNKGLMVLIGFYEDSKSIDPVFNVIHWRGNESNLPRLDSSTKAITFDSGVGIRSQLGILLMDERKNLMASLQRIDMIFHDLKYDINQGLVLMPIEQIAKKIDASLDE
jgi:hypothetical protein